MPFGRLSADREAWIQGQVPHTIEAELIEREDVRSVEK